MARTLWLTMCLAVGCIPLPEPLEQMPTPEAGVEIGDALPVDGATPDDLRPDDGVEPDGAIDLALPDAAPIAEVCNGVDDDGDGRSDEGLLNACGGCGAPLAEACDGVDQDCDFIVDEGAGCPCPAGTTEMCGTDEGECTVGIRGCEAGEGWSECDGVRPSPDICNGLDDDCDGIIDAPPDGAAYDSCDCAPGEVEPCGVDVGACVQGMRSCQDGAWGPCMGAVEPADEGCDGVDDDCDGTVDEGACECEVGTSRACGTDVGRCVAGTEACTYAGWQPCEGRVEPRGEQCDGVDDDCDGTVDESACVCDVGTTRGCGTATGRCERGTESCDFEGWGPCVGAVEPRVERCDGVDDDCDGTIDEDTCVCDVGSTRGCGANVGRCEPGTETCGFDGWGPCEGAVGPRNEGCDGIDDDCDGRVDENPLLPETCETPQCAHAAPQCSNGQIVCQPQPRPESCNGVDDDCDGDADEGLGGAPCQTDRPGICRGGRMTCDPASGAIVCRSTFDARAETCDGVDEDCDGSVDEGLPTRDECIRPRDRWCSNGRLRDCFLVGEPEPIPQ